MLQAVARRIGEAGGQAAVRPADVTDPAAVQDVANAAAAAHGRLDIVVSNAGMNIPERSWQRLSPEGAGAVIEGNLSSAFYVVQAALPIMRLQGDGLFIHTT